MAWEYKLVLLTAAIPRLCFTAFTFTQPFLIDAVIKYLQTDLDKQRRNDGYGLLGAYILVYVGLGVSHLSRECMCSAYTCAGFRSMLPAHHIPHNRPHAWMPSPVDLRENAIYGPQNRRRICAGNADERRH